MDVLSCGEESMTIRLAVLIQYHAACGRQTDVQPISITCFSIADARKKIEKREKCEVSIVFTISRKYLPTIHKLLGS